MTVQGLPYWILTSTRSKCMSVVAPKGQTITVKYDAPGEYINIIFDFTIPFSLDS